jgi:DNA-binding CsgD family transcriptional regulator
LSAQDALSKREQEVLAELRRGGRVPTIAATLSISPTTVRNHLQRIFWKLGVHSQAELIEHVRENPETLKDVDAEARYWSANRRLEIEINEILETRWGPTAFHEVVHRALPLTAAGREEWQARFTVWGRGDATSEEHAGKRKAEMNQWRALASERVERAQKAGWLRSDLSSAEFLEQLFSLLVGVAFQLVTEFDPGRSETQIQVVDAFLDNLIVSDSDG